MDGNNQLTKDCEKLAVLVERYTGIPKERVFKFVMENAATELLPCANMICDTDTQKEKLAALFEFKNLYETVKGAEQSRVHKLNCSTAAINYFKSFYADTNDRERIAVAFLDSQRHVIAAKEMFNGTVNESAVHPREIIKEALFYNAAAVILAHNHPGGSEAPSPADIECTARIKRGMDAVGISLIDHIIVAGERATSLAENGHIPVTDSPVMSKAASPIRDNGGQYRSQTKPSSIKQRIASYKKQFATEQVAAPKKKAAKVKSDTLSL